LWHTYFVEDIKKSINQSPYLKHLPEERREALANLATFIREVQKQYHVHGHGVTSEEEAQSIMEHGLFTKWATLQDLTHAINTHEELAATNITHWQFEGREYVLLVGVPRTENYLASDTADDDSDAWVNRERSRRYAKEHVFEKATPSEGIRAPLGADKRIPPAKIIGYWDDKKGEFHLNPAWQEAQVS
jgi:hypothetical protein